MTIVILVAIVATVTLPGCSKLFSKRSKPAKHGAYFAVTAEKTPFYRYGPQQGGGPDRELVKDTVVTLIRHSFAYSKVRLQDGEQGFLANDDLSPASEHLIAQVTGANEDAEPLPPTPTVKLPTSDSSPEFEPTPIPQELMPH